MYSKFVTKICAIMIKQWRSCDSFGLRKPEVKKCYMCGFGVLQKMIYAIP
jgi:hypothetical protein